ncbi:unnamed protein product, partial [Ectocarpus sp. 12 AP-2014]
LIAPSINAEHRRCPGFFHLRHPIVVPLDKSNDSYLCTSLLARSVSYFRQSCSKSSPSNTCATADAVSSTAHINRGCTRRECVTEKGASNRPPQHTRVARSLPPDRLFLEPDENAVL